MSKKCQRCASDRIVEMVLYLSPDDGDQSEYRGLRCSVDSLLSSPETLHKSFCAQCGQMQGEFPIPEKTLLSHCYKLEEEEVQPWDDEYVSRREKELGIR